MSVESMAVVLNHSRARGTAKLVLLGIANHDGDGGAWPSLATLARYANCKVRAVQYCIAELERLGEIKRELNAGGVRDVQHFERPNLYHVLVNCPADCTGHPRHRRSVDNPVQAFAPGAKDDTPPVQTSAPPPVQGLAPEPSLEPPTELLAVVRTGLRDARARARQEANRGRGLSDPVSDVPGPGDDPGSAAAS